MLTNSHERLLHSQNYAQVLLEDLSRVSTKVRIEKAFDFALNIMEQLHTVGEI